MNRSLSSKGKLERLLESLAADETVEKKDGILSLILLFAYALCMWLELTIIPRNQYYIYIQIAVQIVWLCVIIIILRLRKQKLYSVGLRAEIIPIAMILLITGISIVYSVIRFDTEYIGRWLFYLIAVGGMEEILFRGYVYTRAFKLTGRHWATLLITGILFGAFHHLDPMILNGVPWQGVFSGLGMGIVANLMFLSVYALTGNILNAIILHAAMDYSKYIPWIIVVGVLYVAALIFFRLRTLRTHKNPPHSGE